MKRVIIVFLALVLVVPLVAQEGDELNDGFIRRYKGIVEVGSSIAPGRYSDYIIRTGLHMINAYQFNPCFSLGIGTGVDRVGGTEVTSFLIPVFGDIRVNLIKRMVNPYLSFCIGYSFDPLESIGESSPAPGLYLNATAGIEKKFSDIFAVHLGLGFFLEKVEYNIAPGWGSTDQGPFYLPGMSLNLGLSF